jgi:class 3 adenylate cyclase
MMKWFETTIAWLFPALLVNGTPWAADWAEKERAAFVYGACFMFPIIAVAYVLHLIFYDMAMGLEPQDLWVKYRLGVALACMLGFAFYMSGLADRIRWYRLPAILICALFSILQAFVAHWHDPSVWIWCFLLVIGSTMILRMSALNSFAFAGAIVAVQTPILLDAGVPGTYIFSGSLFTMAMVALIRASYLAEVRNFLLNQENMAAEHKIAELNTEFAGRVRAFIPRVIAERLETYVDREGRTVLEASLDVLQARKKDIACLFSDIRGFTQDSRDLDKFIQQSVIPEMKVCSDAVERHLGIPRKVGDLVFAYFDSDYIKLNLLRAVAAGLEISRLNADMNATATAVNIRRYILISSGEAVVGNIGGLDSSVEITALGPPVNFLSRLDEQTKEPRLARLLRPGDIVLCERSHQLLSEIGLDTVFEHVDLHELGILIRDFPSSRSLYILHPDDNNYEAVMGPYTYIRAQENGHAAIEQHSAGHVPD